MEGERWGSPGPKPHRRQRYVADDYDDDEYQKKDARQSSRTQNLTEEICSAVKDIIQGVLFEVLEGFASLIFSTVYVHGVSTEDKTKLVKEGLGTIWKETINNNKESRWTKVSNKRNKKNRNTIPRDLAHSDSEEEMDLDALTDTENMPEDFHNSKEKIMAWLYGRKWRSSLSEGNPSSSKDSETEITKHSNSAAATNTSEQNKQRWQKR